MQGKTFLTGIVAFSAITTSAMAHNYHWTGNSSNAWDVANNWFNDSTSSVNGYPDDNSDRAFIGITASVDINNIAVVVGKLEMVPTASLNIASSSAVTSLKLDSNGTTEGQVILRANATQNAVIEVDSNGFATELLFEDNTVPHEIGGFIRLRDNLAKMEFSVDSASLVPYDDSGTDRIGFVVGYNDAAKIRVANSLTLESEIFLEGQMTLEAVSGTATLDNRITGQLLADVPGGTLALASSIVLIDTAAGMPLVRPQYVANGGELQFNQSSTSMTGDFFIRACGIVHLQPNVALSTTGLLTGVRGTLQIDAGASFNDAGPPIGGTTNFGTCP